MRLKFIFAWLAVVTGCASKPKCGNPDGAKVILDGKKTCVVRIRQITVGSETDVPASLKKSNFAGFKLVWIEPALKEGQVELGHFALVQGEKAP
jgi:hypothetical protein